MTFLHAIQALVKKLNNIFISVILSLFYLLGIGLGSVIRRLFQPPQQKNSYWLPTDDKIDLNSPY